MSNCTCRVPSHTAVARRERGLLHFHLVADSTPRRVLVVDDDNSILRLIEKLLTLRGFEVVVARNGQEAWSWLDAHDPPDAIVTDLLMPEMDGVDFVKKLRAAPETERTPVLVLTAVASKDPRLDCLRATSLCRVVDKTIAATRGALEAEILELIESAA